MVGEAVTIIGVVVLSITSVGGWVYTLRRNGRSEGKTQQQVNTVVDTVGKLPCQVNSEYLQSIGGLVTAVKNVEKWLTRVEAEQGTIHTRIDSLVNSGGKRKR